MWKFLGILECKECKLDGFTCKYNSYQKNGRVQGPEREKM